MTDSDVKYQPHLVIVEQPVDKFRFRYKSEMAGTHGSLNGMNSDKTRKQTYPTVELKNFTGKAIIRCSIYQINAGECHLIISISFLYFVIFKRKHVFISSK